MVPWYWLIVTLIGGVAIGITEMAILYAKDKKKGR